MVFPKPSTDKYFRSEWFDIFTIRMFWIAWFPVVLIGAFHYAIGPEYHGAHDVLRRLYYFPILFAAFSRGVRGGVIVALVCSLSYAPHAFFVMERSQDPGTTLNKSLEIVLYNAIGILAGILADREARRRLQAERAIAEQKVMAEQLIRAGRLTALGELVAGIAHEIKNPLHTIKGTAEIVDDIIPRQAEQTKMWILLRQEVDRLEGIAERFLSFARPSNPDLQIYTVEEVYQRIGELLKAQFFVSSVKLEIAPLPPELKTRSLRVDRDQLAQVVLNITSNAIKAMEEKGILRISADFRIVNQKRWSTLRIENDGPVILEKDMDRIFDPFFTSYGDGTGLGLFVSHRIVEAHEGYILAENTGTQRGVAFIIFLPDLLK